MDNRVSKLNSILIPYLINILALKKKINLYLYIIILVRDPGKDPFNSGPFLIRTLSLIITIIRSEVFNIHTYTYP